MEQRSFEPGEVIDGRFEVESLVSGGGMGGAVYAVVDRRSGRRVALKVMAASNVDDPSSVARFRREAEVLRHLPHRGIVSVEDAGTLADGTPYLALELLEGRTLSERLEEGPLSIAELRPVVLGLCDALSRAHEEGVVHGDLKCGNIFLPRPDPSRPAVKLIDFGVAKVAGADRLTREGSAVGTIGYMAPEHLRQRDPTPAWDVYALGVVMYCALAGTHPYPHPRGNVLIRAIVAGDHAPLGTIVDVPAAIEAVVARAMALDPRARFATAAGLAEAFAAACED